MTRANDILEMRKDPPAVSALERIASALEKIAGAQQDACDFSAADAFVFTAGSAALMPVPRVNRVDIALLRGIDRARDTLFANTLRFAQGFAANNALLWGARGMGKSALVKGVHGAINRRLAGIAIVQASQTYRDPPGGHRGASPPDDSFTGSTLAVPHFLRRSFLRWRGYQLQIPESRARWGNRGTPAQCFVLCNLEPPPYPVPRYDRERARHGDQSGRRGPGEGLAVGPLRSLARLSFLLARRLSGDGFGLY